MSKTIIKGSVVIGNPKKLVTKNGRRAYLGRPKKKYRIIVQERLSVGASIEASRSFMIYDFKGMSSIESIKNRLKKVNKK